MIRRIFILAALVLALARPAAAQTPDLTSMSGIPLPMADVPPGVATVRVVRFDMSHPVTGLDVTLQPVAGGAARVVKTDSTGRAAFEGLGDTEYVARVTLDGKELRSQPFRAGAQSGIRMLLVGAGAAGAAAPAAPGAAAPAAPGGAAPGGAAPAAPAGRGALPPGHPPIGDDEERQPASAPSGPMTTDPSRLSLASGSEVIVDFVEDAVRVTALLRLRNDGQTYDPGPRGLAFTLPDGVADLNLARTGARLKADGKRAVIVQGPVAPGETRVAVQYIVPYKRGMTMAMQMPVRSDGLVVGVRPTGLSVEIPGASVREEITTAEGQRYVVYQLGALPAGNALTLRLTHGQKTQWAAGGAVFALLGWLVFGSRRRRDRAEEVAELEAQRDRLMADLVALEQRDRAKGGRRYEQRRGELVGKLEQLYREIDAGDAPLM
ncbi:MAG TPA: carboxypeptidase-like regulatory domain-containing protein [Polyangia bacterium]|jgi:hypothetical protein